MNAQELETELAKVRGELATLAAELRGKDGALGDRAKTADEKIKAVEDLAQSCDKRIDLIAQAVEHLKSTLAEQKVERDKWGGRFWQLGAVAFGSVLTAVVAVLLTMAGIRKP